MALAIGVKGVAAEQRAHLAHPRREAEEGRAHHVGEDLGRQHVPAKTAGGRRAAGDGTCAAALIESIWQERLRSCGIALKPPLSLRRLAWGRSFQPQGGFFLEMGDLI